MSRYISTLILFLGWLCSAFGQVVILNPVSGGVTLPSTLLEIPFDEGTGNPAFSGSEGSGTATCTDLTWAATPPAGDFNGTTSVCDVGTILDEPASYTVAACIQMDNFGETSLGRIHEKNTKYIFSVNAQGGVNNLQSYHLGTTGNDRFDSPNSSLTAALGTWYRVLASITGADGNNVSVQLYIDGSAVTSTQGSDTKSGDPDDSAQTLYIGNRAAGDRTFNGRIRLWIAYSAAVNAAQALADYNANPCGT